MSGKSAERLVSRRWPDTVEVVHQVHFNFGNGRAEGRRTKIDALEQSLPRIVHGERTPEYTLDDVDVCPSTVQGTLEIDLSALQKGH